ncbi:MAG: hypothetical protein AAFO29_18700 [Actinomycetota bacterium]
MTQPSNDGDQPGSTADAAKDLLAANDMTEDRLAAILAEAGFEAELAGFDPEIVGTGQVGENVRCHLRWAGAEAEATTAAGAAGQAPGQGSGQEPPATVILKLPSSDPVSRATGGATRSYIREVGFYRDVANQVAIRVPAAHHVWEDQATNRFLLVMEDINPAATGDQLAGGTLDQAGLAVDAAAALHGSSWDRTDLAELDWVDSPDPARAGERAELFAALYPGVVDRYRAR